MNKCDCDSLKVWTETMIVGMEVMYFREILAKRSVGLDGHLGQLNQWEELIIIVIVNNNIYSIYFC